jgi:hypothetical protein
MSRIKKSDKVTELKALALILKILLILSNFFPIVILFRALGLCLRDGGQLRRR